jgi:hypothetical protein
MPPVLRLADGAAMVFFLVLQKGTPLPMTVFRYDADRVMSTSRAFFRAWYISWWS